MYEEHSVAGCVDTDVYADAHEHTHKVPRRRLMFLETAWTASFRSGVGELGKICLAGVEFVGLTLRRICPTFCYHETDVKCKESVRKRPAPKLRRTEVHCIRQEKMNRGFARNDAEAAILGFSECNSLPKEAE